MSYNFGGITGFMRSESGAVSVDWVVLSASIVGIGLAAVVSVQTGAANMGAEVSYTLRAATIAGMGGGNLSAPAADMPVTGLAAEAPVSAYTPLVATQSELEILVQQLAASNDNATLAASYAHYAEQTAGMLAAGDHQNVPGFLDTVSAFEQALQRNGGSAPLGTPSVQSLRAAYDQGNS